MEKKLIDLYKEWSKKGRIPTGFGGGLCLNIPVEYVDTIELFKPGVDERWEWLDPENLSHIFWGNEKPYTDSVSESYKLKIRTRFNPFRKTIVLFICAMHNEL